MKVTIVVLEICNEFGGDCFLEVKEDCLFDVAAVLVDVELLDVGFAELADHFVCLLVGEAGEDGVPHFWVVRDAEPSIEVSVFWFIGGTLRRIQDHPVLVVPGRMHGSFFRLEVMVFRSAVASSLVGMALTV